MNSLKQLQTDFLNALLDQHSATPRQVLPGQQLNADQRMKLYQDAYRLRLLEALSDSFPVLHALAGDELFESLGNDFIKAHPSNHFTIRYFGDRLANFLANDECYKNIPVLSEMARFEWQLRYAFDGKDASPLKKTDFTHFSLEQWPHLCFELLPSFSRVQLDWNVPQIWLAITHDEEPADPQLLTSSTHWIIWRPELITRFRSVDNIEDMALRQLQDKSNFSQLCDAFQNANIPDPAQTMAGILNRWLEDGLLAAVSVNQD